MEPADAGKQIGVDKSSIANWESNRLKQGIRYMPAIIRLIGYNPLPPRGWAANTRPGPNDHGFVAV